MSNIIKSVDCPNESYPAGKVIFEEGTQSNGFYIIKSGQIDVYRSYGKPDQIHLASIPAGRVLGEISCLDDGPRTATAVAKTDVHLVRISAFALKWQLKQCPQWFGAVILDLVERLRSTNELVASEHGGNSHHEMTSMKATDST